MLSLQACALASGALGPAYPIPVYVRAHRHEGLSYAYAVPCPVLLPEKPSDSNTGRTTAVEAGVRVLFFSAPLCEGAHRN